MNKLQVGFSKINVTPPLGIGVAGYYVPRFAEGVLDELEVRCLAVNDDKKTVLLISVPSCGVGKKLSAEYSALIQEATGVDADNVFLSATHTHTGGVITANEAFETDETVVASYRKFMGERIRDAAALAIADLKPAKMGYIVGWAPERVAYIRRYKMKSGITMTCPPINDPDIDYPIGELDQRVNVLRFDREGEDSIVLVNYGLHADTINGSMLSSDWPHFMYETLEKALDGVKCIFFNGAEGDVGSTNVHPEGGDMNDTEISFDNEMKSYGMARFVGRAIAGTVLQVYDKVCYVDVDKVNIIKKDVAVDANKATKEELVLAHEYKEYHESGHDEKIPYTAMELTTVVAEALRMCRLENAPDQFMLPLTAVQIGDVALLGIPGEPFTEIGVKIKEAEGWKMIMPCCLTNGDEGYLPVQSAFGEGGYEARTTQYKAGVAEKIINGGKSLLDSLRK